MKETNQTNPLISKERASKILRGTKGTEGLIIFALTKDGLLHHTCVTSDKYKGTIYEQLVNNSGIHASKAIEEFVNGAISEFEKVSKGKEDNKTEGS
jgi:hypothetical protein